MFCGHDHHAVPSIPSPFIRARGERLFSLSKSSKLPQNASLLSRVLSFLAFLRGWCSIIRLTRRLLEPLDYSLFRVDSRICTPIYLRVLKTYFSCWLRSLVHNFPLFSTSDFFDIVKELWDKNDETSHFKGEHKCWPHPLHYHVDVQAHINMASLLE